MTRTDKAHAPQNVADDTLDAISGGPHFRNFHGTTSDVTLSNVMKVRHDTSKAVVQGEGDKPQFQWNIAKNKAE